MKRLREDPLAPVLQLRPDLPRALALLGRGGRLAEVTQGLLKGRR